MELPRPPLKQNLAAAYSCARHAPAKARPKLFGNNSITEFKSSPTGEGGLSSNLRTTKINKREETAIPIRVAIRRSICRHSAPSRRPFAFFSPLGLFDDPDSDKSIHVSDDRIRWIDSLAHTKKKIPLHPPSGGHVTTLSLSAPS